MRNFEENSNILVDQNLESVSQWINNNRYYSRALNAWGVGAYSRVGAYKLFLPLGWALIRGGR